MKAGFIGLGGIGKPMAMNVARAGFELTVTDLRTEAVQELVAIGAHSVATPREVAAASDIIFASLPSNAASEAVARGREEVLQREAAQPGVRDRLYRARRQPARWHLRRCAGLQNDRAVHDFR